MNRRCPRSGKLSLGDRSTDLVARRTSKCDDHYIFAIRRRWELLGCNEMIRPSHAQFLEASTHLDQVVARRHISRGVGRWSFVSCTLFQIARRPKLPSLFYPKPGGRSCVQQAPLPPKPALYVKTKWLLKTALRNLAPGVRPKWFVISPRFFISR